MDESNRREEPTNANTETPEREKQQQEDTTSELLESAKVVADAAKTALAGGTDKVDKAKAADAAEDLLEAVQQYGKLDESKGMGKYVEQAENYLHQYASGDSKTADGGSAAEEKASGGGGYGDVMKMAGSFMGGGEKTGEEERKDDETSTAGGGHETSSGGGGGGFGDVMKMAQGFMSK